MDLFKQEKVEENKAETVVLAGSPLSTHWVLPSPSRNKQLTFPSTAPSSHPALGSCRSCVVLGRRDGAFFKKKKQQKASTCQEKKKSNIFSVVSWLWKGDVTAMENGQILRAIKNGFAFSPSSPPVSFHVLHFLQSDFLLSSKYRFQVPEHGAAV